MFAILAVSGAYPALSQVTQRTFSSPADASQNLFQAVQKNDEKAIDNILGGPTDLASSGDEAQDKADRQMFVVKYQEMHRVAREPDGSMALYIGAENWPFPVPLVQKNGVWRFNAEAGQKEVLFRRIGDNELAAIASCHQFVADEKQNQANPSALKTADNFPASLITKAADKSGSGQRALYHGYYFHVLAKRADGRFTMIAYPAEYRSSGVMTFVVTDENLVYEKDLGPNTSAIASALTGFHKDASWHDADE
jgi:hypothetical protein